MILHNRDTSEGSRRDVTINKALHLYRITHHRIFPVSSSVKRQCAYPTTFKSPNPFPISVFAVQINNLISAVQSRPSVITDVVILAKGTYTNKVSPAPSHYSKRRKRPTKPTSTVAAKGISPAELSASESDGMVCVDAVVRTVRLPGEEIEVTIDVGGVAGQAVEPQLLQVFALVHGAQDYAVVFGITCHSIGVAVPFDSDGETGIGDWEGGREQDCEELELHPGGLVVSLEVGRR